MQQYERSTFVMGNLWGTHEEPVEDNYRRIVKAPPGQAPPRGIKVRLGAHQGSPNRKNVGLLHLILGGYMDELICSMDEL